MKQYRFLKIALAAGVLALLVSLLTLSALGQDEEGVLYLSQDGTVQTEAPADMTNVSRIDTRLQMLDGAAVRYDGDDSGIRFEIELSADALVQLMDASGADAVSWGALIAPLDLVGDVALRHDALTAAAVPFADVQVSGFAGVREDGDTVYYYASLIGLREENFTRTFTSVGYLKVGDVYLYTAHTGAHERSIAQVSQKALEEETDLLRSQRYVLHRYLGQVLSVAESDGGYITSDPSVSASYDREQMLMTLSFTGQVPEGFVTYRGNRYDLQTDAVFAPDGSSCTLAIYDETGYLERFDTIEPESVRQAVLSLYEMYNEEVLLNLAVNLCGAGGEDAAYLLSGFSRTGMGEAYGGLAAGLPRDMVNRLASEIRALQTEDGLFGTLPVSTAREALETLKVTPVYSYPELTPADGDVATLIDDLLNTGAERTFAEYVMLWYTLASAVKADPSAAETVAVQAQALVNATLARMEAGGIETAADIELALWMPGYVCEAMGLPVLALYSSRDLRAIGEIYDSYVPDDTVSGSMSFHESEEGLEYREGTSSNADRSVRTTNTANTGSTDTVVRDPEGTGNLVLQEIKTAGVNARFIHFPSQEIFFDQYRTVVLEGDFYLSSEGIVTPSGTDPELLQISLGGAVDYTGANSNSSKRLYMLSFQYRDGSIYVADRQNGNSVQNTLGGASVGTDSWFRLRVEYYRTGTGDFVKVYLNDVCAGVSRNTYFQDAEACAAQQSSVSGVYFNGRNAAGYTLYVKDVSLSATNGVFSADDAPQQDIRSVEFNTEEGNISAGSLGAGQTFGPQDGAYVYSKNQPNNGTTLNLGGIPATAFNGANTVRFSMTFTFDDFDIQDTAAITANTNHRLLMIKFGNSYWLGLKKDYGSDVFRVGDFKKDGNVFSNTFAGTYAAGETYTLSVDLIPAAGSFYALVRMNGTLIGVSEQRYSSYSPVFDSVQLQFMKRFVGTFRLNGASLVTSADITMPDATYQLSEDDATGTALEGATVEITPDGLVFNKTVTGVNAPGIQSTSWLQNAAGAQQVIYSTQLKVNSASIAPNPGEQMSDNLNRCLMQMRFGDRYMIALYLDDDGEGFRIEDVNTTANSPVRNRLTGSYEFGKTYALEVRISGMDASTFRAQLWIDGILIAESDNYYVQKFASEPGTGLNTGLTQISSNLQQRALVSMEMDYFTVSCVYTSVQD